MVVALGPGKFYGSSLPRPRIYTDVKYSSDRVEPPVPVLDALLSWAEEAHWSMGGLSFNRHRLQGRIEGNVEKLRNQIEKSIKKKKSLSPKLPKKKFISKSVEILGKKRRQSADLKQSPSPPPAPLANKRRRYLGSFDEDEDAEPVRKFPVRKLSEYFDRVANGKKSPARGSDTAAVASRTRGSKMDKVKHTKVVSKGKKRLRKIGEAENGSLSPSMLVFSQIGEAGVE